MFVVTFRDGSANLAISDDWEVIGSAVVAHVITAPGVAAADEVTADRLVTGPKPTIIPIDRIQLVYLAPDDYVPAPAAPVIEAPVDPAPVTP